MRDAIALVEDSLRRPFFDSLSGGARARFDSVQTTWRDAFRVDLGLPPTAPQSRMPPGTPRRGTDSESSSASPDQSTIAMEAEIVGDGPAQYRGDTALVPRVVRYARLDTTVTFQLALVALEHRYWRLVAMPNAIAVLRAVGARKATVLERANRPRRDSIAARISVSQISITREPLAEWDRYAARVQVTVQNRSPESLSVQAVQLLGPNLALHDSLGEFLREPITLRPGESIALAWERPLRGDQPGPYDVVARPDSYTVAVTAIETHHDGRHRLELYRTWEEYIAENPLPARPSGVLAGRSGQGAAELAAALLERDNQGTHRITAH